MDDDDVDDPDTHGAFEVSVTFKIRDRVSISVFVEGNNDATSTWPDTHIAPASEMSCAERQLAAWSNKRLWETNVCVTNSCESLKPYEWANNANPANGQNLVTVTRHFEFTNRYPMWMYVVLSNCDEGELVVNVIVIIVVIIAHPISSSSSASSSSSSASYSLRGQSMRV